jgi:hypothetical protein
VETGVLEVWRSITFDKIYEMNGENHVSTNAAANIIQPKFDPAFVTYSVGAVNAIPAEKSVKYVGLWDNNAASHQQDWAAIQAKKAGVNYTLLYGPHAGAVVATEVPTAEELANAELPEDNAARAPAREAITKKAQAWTERIDSSFMSALTNWQANGGIANNSLVGIKYFHPKYNPSAGDAATNEWPGWARVTTYLGSYDNRDPDDGWALGGGDFGGLPVGNGIVAISKGQTAAETKKSVAHETGHATKDVFKRDVFGPTLDHSQDAGLMDANATQADFSARELKILRGIKP